MNTDLPLFLAGLGIGMFAGALVTLAALVLLTGRRPAPAPAPGPVEAAEAITRQAARERSAEQ
ncbi:hypothetical protein B4N89_27340 [Embleya scabrispora]|uniref:Uncharacterized protein n=1 Tax=Embleya scabrispora TaxID=159449 RepID=A0A1T3P4Y8_9ACTN|nr:hypothetical protein [Embleya scabrispora]OPC84146.1 hypothetical protein B4N89_27340 [Embleya scabrispora]